MGDVPSASQIGQIQWKAQRLGVRYHLISFSFLFLFFSRPTDSLYLPCPIYSCVDVRVIARFRPPSTRPSSRLLDVPSPSGGQKQTFRSSPSIRKPIGTLSGVPLSPASLNGAGYPNDRSYPSGMGEETLGFAINYIDDTTVDIKLPTDTKVRIIPFAICYCYRCFYTFPPFLLIFANHSIRFTLAPPFIIPFTFLSLFLPPSPLPSPSLPFTLLPPSLRPLLLMVSVILLSIVSSPHQPLNQRSLMRWLRLLLKMS